MAINGSLDEASLADVLQLLSLGQKTGRLSVSDQSNLGHVYLDTGKITHAFLVNRRQRLGDILFKSGHITQDQLSDVMAKQKQNPEKRVGEILVETGAISADALRQNMQVQIEEAVYFLFTWRRGDFAFARDVKPDPDDFLVSINPESLLLEAARRVDEWSVIEKKVPSFDMVFTVDNERLEASEAKLSEEQKRIASMLDGARDAAAIVVETGMIEFDVGRALYGLITAGFAEAAEPSGGRDLDGSSSDDRSGHLNHARLLAYLAHEGEFADEKRRRLSRFHIADCPTCSKRLQKIHIRRSQGLSAVPDLTDGTVDEAPAQPQPSSRRTATREAAVQVRPPVERRKLDDRRNAASRKRQRRIPVHVDRSDRVAVERRSGLERRLNDRRAVPRRVTDLGLRGQVGQRQTAALDIGAGSSGSSGSLGVTTVGTSFGAPGGSGSENHSARQTGTKITARSSSALLPKDKPDAKAPKVPDQGSPSTPSDSTTPTPMKRSTRPSVRRMRESPLRGLPLLADGTDWQFVERVETEAELDPSQVKEKEPTQDADATSSPNIEPGAEPATLESGPAATNKSAGSVTPNMDAATPELESAKQTAGEKTPDPDVAKPASKSSRWWSRSKPKDQDLESAKRELERERKELENAKKELKQAKSDAAKTKLDADQAKSEAEQARVEAADAKKRAEKAEENANMATTEAETIKSDAAKRKSEAVQTELEANNAKLELEKAKADAQSAKLEAEKVKSEAERAKSDADQARVEAEKANKRAEKAEANAEEATTKAETVKSDAVKRKSEAVQTKSAVKKAKLELETAKAEAEEARQQAEKAKAEAEKAKSEADEATAYAVTIKSGADQTELEVSKAKSELDKAKADAARAILEAEKARSEAEQAKSEAEQARLEAQRVKLDADKLSLASEIAELEAEEETTELPQARLGRGTPVTLSQPRPRAGRGTPVSLGQLFGAAAPGSGSTRKETAPKKAVRRSGPNSSPSQQSRKSPIFWLGIAAALIVAAAAGRFAWPLLSATIGNQAASANTSNVATDGNPPAVQDVPVAVADSAQQVSEAVASPSTPEVPLQAEVETAVAPPVQPVVEERPSEPDVTDVPPPTPEQEQPTIDSAPARVDPVVSTATITGSVRAFGTGTVVAGALVLMPDLDLSTRTDATGSFAFDGVPAGSLSVAVTYDGFLPKRETIVAESGGSIVLDVELRGPPNALGSDEELDGGQWTITDLAEASIVLGRPVAIIADLWVESVARPTTGTRPRVRVAHLTESGERITLVESRSGPVNAAAISRVTALRIIPPTEAYSITTGTVSFGNLLVTAKATLPEEALRSFLQRLSESEGN